MSSFALLCLVLCQFCFWANFWWHPEGLKFFFGGTQQGSIFFFVATLGGTQKGSRFFLVAPRRAQFVLSPPGGQPNGSQEGSEPSWEPKVLAPSLREVGKTDP